jgi:hypothetical protein
LDYYHPYLSSSTVRVGIKRRRKIRQPTYSRDKFPAGLLLTSFPTLRKVLAGKENSEASQAL